jgi:hypothetical protein
MSARAGHDAIADAFAPDYLDQLRRQIRACRWFTVNNLNRDFVGTRGFSVVFRRDAIARAIAEFPCFEPYLARALRADCNAFYLNPLQLESGSRVDPHIDRSLRSYCKDITTPLQVSVLYVDVPPAMQGGALVLQRGKKTLARITPRPNLLLAFDGDLMHSVERVDSPGLRLSLVCEQYALDERELAQIPSYRVETRARSYD